VSIFYTYQDALIHACGDYKQALKNCLGEKVVVDRVLIIGQNLASAVVATNEMLKMMK